MAITKRHSIIYFSFQNSAGQNKNDYVKPQKHSMNRIQKTQKVNIIESRDTLRIQFLTTQLQNINTKAQPNK